MVDVKLLSLRWKNFNYNLLSGIYESLCGGELVDLTLVAEGQQVQAHRIVLSLCSSYFRNIFTEMPANQPALVPLQDVSYATLKDLLQYMYTGEVIVSSDALPAIARAAEVLQIKGLTETEQAPATASSLTPVEVSPPVPSIASVLKPAPIVSRKRVISRSITSATAPELKRTKNLQPLEASEPPSTQQTITVIESSITAERTELIDLTGEDDDKASGSYAESGDKSAKETHGVDDRHFFVKGQKGCTYLVHNAFMYTSDMVPVGRNLNELYWNCVHRSTKKCSGRAKSTANKLFVTDGNHNHEHDVERLKAAYDSECLAYGSFKFQSSPKNRARVHGRTISKESLSSLKISGDAMHSLFGKFKK